MIQDAVTLQASGRRFVGTGAAPITRRDGRAGAASPENALRPDRLRARSTIVLRRRIELLHQLLHLGAGQRARCRCAASRRPRGMPCRSWSRRTPCAGRRALPAACPAARCRSAGTLVWLITSSTTLRSSSFLTYLNTEGTPMPVELGVRLEADLQQHVDLVVAQPVRLLRLEARPVPAAHAVDLAALDRQRRYRASRDSRTRRRTCAPDVFLCRWPYS